MEAAGAACVAAQQRDEMDDADMRRSSGAIVGRHGVGAPAHVGIIMDGNGRWAAQRSLPRLEGHRRGVDALRRTVRAAIDLGIRYLTIYSFSAENWTRPQLEVRGLMALLKLYISNDLADLHANDVRIRIIGDRAGLPTDIAPLLSDAEERTRHNRGLVLNVAFNYGGRQEILDATRSLAADVAAGNLDPAAITAELFESRLTTAGMPDPDLVIRTSGEQRLSNFLPWQSAYSEFVFLPVLWPDFDRADLEEALAEYARRERRFGGASVDALAQKNAS
jgi:undecaprenyl diphosphate synthase